MYGTTCLTCTATFTPVVHTHLQTLLSTQLPFYHSTIIHTYIHTCTYMYTYIHVHTCTCSVHEQLHNMYKQQTFITKCSTCVYIYYGSNCIQYYKLIFFFSLKCHLSFLMFTIKNFQTILQILHCVHPPSVLNIVAKKNLAQHIY